MLAGELTWLYHGWGTNWVADNAIDKFSNRLFNGTTQITALHAHPP